MGHQVINEFWDFLRNDFPSETSQVGGGGTLSFINPRGLSGRYCRGHLHFLAKSCQSVYVFLTPPGGQFCSSPQRRERAFFSDNEVLFLTKFRASGEREKDIKQVLFI